MTRVLALAPLFVLLGLFLPYCIRDLVRVPAVRYLPKPAWAVIICISIPFGALAYLAFGRDERPSGDRDRADDHLPV